jgi:hypothetical protein
MNLVQINERLKDLPMQVIQQYANGMNPEVPPYLALSELQRRESSQKQAAATQGGAQGPQPSIKEQIEQKAGLMALQQAQQQQMQQQQPRGPMSSPAGVPQPQMQPQAPQAMMARGGLAGIPVRRDMFEYARGGIIAFAEGGNVEEKYRKESEEMGEGKRVQFSPDVQAYAKQIRASENADQEGFAQRERQRMLEQSREISPERAPPMAGPNVTAETMKRVGPMTAPKFADPRMAGAGLPDALNNITSTSSPARATPPTAGPAAQRPAATPPVASPAQAAEQPNTSPFLAEAATMARDKPVAPTPEGVIAEQKKLLPAGMQEEAMQKMFADQRARAEGRQAAYDKSKPSGLDDLIRVFGQAGQYKGMSGMGPAYTANQDRRRAEDLAMQKQQDELMTAIEGRQYGADEKMFGARKEAMSAANNSFQNRLMTNTKSLADLAGVDQRRMDEALNRLSQEKLERLRITARAAEASRPGEAERIEAKYMGMIAKGQVKEAEEYLSRISKIKGGAGIDRNPTPTDRLRAAQSIMNDIDSTAEEKAMAKKEIASIMAGNRAGGEGPTKTPITKAEYDKLPKGASYTAPDGTQRTKG